MSSQPLILPFATTDRRLAAPHTRFEVDFSGIKTEKDYFHTVGLPDAAVRESRDRVRSAIKNSGFDVPPTHITIHLAPR